MYMMVRVMRITGLLKMFRLFKIREKTKKINISTTF